MEEDVPRTAHEASGLVSPTKMESELELVKNSVHRVIEKGLEGVRDLDTRRLNEIRFWLRSHQKDKPHGKPFRKY